MKYYNQKLERGLIKIGCKRVWFSDKSGYWLEKNFKFKDLNLRLYIEPDQKKFYFSIKLETPEQYETIKTYKLTLSNVKKLLKKYS